MTALAIVLLTAAVVYISNRVAGAVIALALAVHRLVQAWSATETRLARLEASDELIAAHRSTAKAYRELTATLDERVLEIKQQRASVLLATAPESKSTH